MTETKAEAQARYRAEKAAATEARQKRVAEVLAAKEAARVEKAERAEKAKAARVARFHHGEDWKHGEFSQRGYADYAAYLDHQADKLPGLTPSLMARFDDTTAGFAKRFALLNLPPPTSVLCLGARLGQEVKAFHSLGHFAVGVDLNPGELNPYVVAGDFHQLQFPDASVGCVYINSVDHILMLDRFTAEVRRVLRPDGLFVAEIVAGHEEGFVAGEYEALHWPRAESFARQLGEIGGFRLESTRWLDEVGASLWLQCRYRLS